MNIRPFLLHPIISVLSLLSPFHGPAVLLALGHSALVSRKMLLPTSATLLPFHLQGRVSIVHVRQRTWADRPTFGIRVLDISIALRPLTMRPLLTSFLLSQYPVGFGLNILLVFPDDTPQMAVVTGIPTSICI